MRTFNVKVFGTNIAIIQDNDGKFIIPNEFRGFGTGLKPAYEPIVVARKPLSEKSVAENVLKWGTGGINIDGCRIKYQSEEDKKSATPQGRCTSKEIGAIGATPDAGRNLNRVDFLRPEQKGRFPANIILDEEAAKLLDEQTGNLKSGKAIRHKSGGKNFGSGTDKPPLPDLGYNDCGGASRFFYVAKASKSEKGNFNTHPTVKPLKLIKYLITLVTPPGGICLDLFEGSGTHAVACQELGFNYIGFELYEEYIEIANKRLII